MKPCALAIMLLCLVGSSLAAGANDAGELAFGVLRQKIAELRPHEPTDVQDKMEKMLPYITPCPPGTPEPGFGGRGGIALDDEDYLYSFEPTSADGKYSCVFLVEPLHRALMVDEARDFADALLMMDLPRSVAGKASRAQQALRAKLGEKHFAEIRALVAEGKAKLLAPETTERIIRSIGNLDHLEDCSQTSIEILEHRAYLNPLASDNRILYNDTYYWRDLDPNGSRCIYMVEPFHRGLTVEEARDFLTALQLDLGYSEEFGRQMSDGEPTNSPNPTH